MTELWSALPEALRDPVALAAPFFVVLIALEALAAHLLEDDRGGYDRRDAFASIGAGAVSIVTMSLWKALGLLGYAALFAYVAPWQLPEDRWWTWAIALVGLDFLFYWTHRTAHRVRLVWATHQAHHSSEYFNFATALRQKWNNSHELLFWAPLPLLGVPPALVFLAFSGSLV